jgi:hypothetical protein
MKQAHDAETGFHDIKALAEVETHSNGQELLTWLLGIAALLLIARLFISYIKGLPKLKSNQTEDIFETSKGRIKTAFSSFQNSSIDKKTLGEEVSNALRTLLTSTVNYPAEDRTFLEIKSNLPSALKQKFSYLEPSKVSGFQNQMEGLLRLTSEICYQNPQFSSKQVGEEMERLEAASLEVVDSLKDLGQQQRNLEKNALEEEKKNEL